MQTKQISNSSTYVAAISLKVFFISQFSPLSEHLHFSGINMSILTSTFCLTHFCFVLAWNYSEYAF